MENQTVKLHRVVTASPEKVYKAFSDPIAQASWSPPYGFLCTVQEHQFYVGGTFKMTFINFGTGHQHSFGGKFINLVANEFLQYSDTFDDPNLPGTMITSISLKAVSCGTSIEITQEGIPEMIPVEMCYLGWQESLEKLKKLVEPVIPDHQ